MTDKIHDEVDIESIIDMVDDDVMESFSMDVPPLEEHIEDEQEEIRPIKAKEDDRNIRLYQEALDQNVKLLKELENTTIAKEQAESVALQSALRGFETQIQYAGGDIERLKAELVKARDDGDTASSVDIENRMRENYEYIRDLKSKIDQYSPLLNVPKTTVTRSIEEPKKEINRLAEEWVKENEHWLNDPKQADKKEYADRIFKDLQSSNVDISSLSFWTRFEKNLSEYDNKGSNSKSQVRMPKNMVTYNSTGSGSSNNSNKQSYKNNPEFIQKVAYLVKNVIKNEDALKDKNMVNSMLKHYHKVYKEGGFKHMPATLN